MAELKDLFQSADWKSEKHVPAIEAPDQAEKDKLLEVTVTVGKEIPHPNTVEHHIRWIEVYFHPEGGKFPYQVARAEFCSHGESTEEPVSAHPRLTCAFKTTKSGNIMAASYCNIHGLWQSSKKLTLK